MSESAFVLRGNRDYVLGVDILWAALHQLRGHGRGTLLDFNVKQPCCSTACLCVPRDQAGPAEHMRAVALLRDATHDVVILPQGERATQRVPCEEARMAEHFTYDSAEGRPLVHVSALPLQGQGYGVCVAAFKYLLNTRVATTPRRYLFARLQLDTGPLEAFSIRYERLFAGRFHEGRILAQGKPCGAIYFTEGA